jgi:hypothetical protein
VPLVSDAYEGLKSAIGAMFLGAARPSRAVTGQRRLRRLAKPDDPVDDGGDVSRPPGTGKTHLAIAIGIRACLAGRRVAFATATEWVARLAEAQREGTLAPEIARLQRIPLIVVDEVGYIPFDQAAANVIFQLVSARYERASIIVTSNKPFSGWGEIFGDEVVAAAMIDRLVHHAEILSLKGDSFRFRPVTVGPLQALTTPPHPCARAGPAR